eukprot:gnl/TRDRNA2_/TRDRNA2_152476_c0_seq4.p1 gnl/TRDRNA2_/TRDRNA2_152476_c0~~gnl/TRDRNA2_/TRDRNA2_152476_c0_seq4.p1  ORF type:complete len:104 (+),score=12.47 gnl/TRDRNA2_/TRDRNA2_152476_c0_seq4:329-640(+)
MEMDVSPQADPGAGVPPQTSEESFIFNDRELVYGAFGYPSLERSVPVPLRLPVVAQRPKPPVEEDWLDVPIFCNHQLIMDAFAPSPKAVPASPVTNPFPLLLP